MRHLAFAVGLCGILSAMPALGAKAASIGIRGGQLSVSGDVEDATGPVYGVSVLIGSPKAWDVAWGIAPAIDVALLYGHFDYEGTDWPFDSEEQTSFSAFTISPGVMFFTDLPVQLQLGLPLTRIDLSQKDEFRQRYGTDGYLVRIGHLVADKFSVSVEYEMHTISQTLLEDETKMQIDMATATLGWIPGD